MDKALSYLALARKAGFAELGEEPVGAAARLGHARQERTSSWFGCKTPRMKWA